MTARGRAVDACRFQLQAWNPFSQIQQTTSSLDSFTFPSKKPCLSDRSTTPALDSLDFFRLSLLDDPHHHRDDVGFRWIPPRKRRRRGSRSVSGRSSDRSGARRRGGVSAANATCSDFPFAACGTDSSGELFLTGEVSWGSDVGERVSRRDGTGREAGGGEGLNNGLCVVAADSSQGNESGYGSEPGYRGDAELGYGDEVDEEDEDGRHMLFWGGESRRMEIVGESCFAEQKSHHRCRRKKNEWRF